MDANADAKERSVFLADAYELLAALGKYSPRVQQTQEKENLLDPRQPRTVKAKKLGGDLFAKNPPRFNRSDSLQLKAAWEKAGFNYRFPHGITNAANDTEPITI